jgi:ketosteroid isomerase-like protein
LPHMNRIGPLEADAIREARAMQTAAIASGDLDRVASYWTDDVTIRRALGQAVEGAAAARKIFATDGHGAAALIYQRRAIEIDVSEIWPLAYEAGIWSGHLGSADAPKIIGGRYSAQWVKRDGRWLIRSEVFVALTCAATGCGLSAEP